MNKIVRFCCCMVPFFVTFALTQSLRYSDLEALNVTCFETDSCRTIPDDSSFIERNCECDRDCVPYGDCCIDVDQPRNIRRYQGISCVEFGDASQGSYMVSRCANSFKGDADLRRLCQAWPRNVSDPVMSAPVTDTILSVTYNNRYCAECNDANVDYLQPWLIKINCNLNRTPTESEISGLLHYSQSDNKWGVLLDNAFHECKLQFNKPPTVTRNIIRECRPNVISTCPRSYRINSIRRACDLYMDVVYGSDNTKYRNPHCAICNGVAVKDIRCCCNIFTISRVKPFTFSMLVDVDRSDGDTVGVKERCPPGEKYDKFFDKCRVMSCALPSHTVVDGKCVK